MRVQYAITRLEECLFLNDSIYENHFKAFAKDSYDLFALQVITKMLFGYLRKKVYIPVFYVDVSYLQGQTYGEWLVILKN